MNNEKYGCESYDNSVPDNWAMRVTPELAEKVQRILFKRGARWCDGTTDVMTDKVNLLFFKENRLSYSHYSNQIESDIEEISAYAFVASNGRCKWLPAPGEKCLVRDLECEAWVAARFSHYRNYSGLPISANRGSFKQIKPYEEPKPWADFAEFLQEHSVLKKFKENCRPENQRWAHIPNYYSNLSDLGSTQPKQYLSNAFNWGRSPLFTHTELHSLERAWIKLLLLADRATFDKNNLFQEC